MRYTFDETGSVIGFSTHYPNFTNGYWEDYLFAKNLQGDVVALYRWNWSDEGKHTVTLEATYSYDPWGKLLSVKNASGSPISATLTTNIANVNPFRYRGYYYDTETGFYYLQSRYYDPVISRFINADSYGSTGQAFLGTNMFAYCNNNCSSRADVAGTAPGDLFGSVDDAAIDFANCYNGLSIHKNREYATYFYLAGTTTETRHFLFFSWTVEVNQYSYSEPFSGDEDGVVENLDRIDGNKVVALGHTHAAYDSRYKNDEFSPQDKLIAKTFNKPLYVATPIGKLLKCSVKLAVSTISRKIVHDGNHPGLIKKILGFKIYHERCEKCA